MNITRYIRHARNDKHPVQFIVRTLESILPEEMMDESNLLSQSMYTILWVQQGKGEIAIDASSFDIEDNTLYYIKPGQAFRAIIEEASRGFLISFEKEFFDLFEKSSFRSTCSVLLDHSCMSPVIRIQSDMNLLLKNIVDKMLQEYNHFNEMRAEIISSFLRIFIIYLSRQFEIVETDADKRRKSELYSIFFTLLEKHFVDKKMVKDYADALALTPGYLNKVVKEVTGFSASYHIQQRIVLEAKRRAIFGSDNLKEIAYKLGFCDPAHFSKFFKSGAGTNFTKFKKTALSYC